LRDSRVAEAETVTVRLLEIPMRRSKLRRLAGKLKDRLEEVLEAAAGALVPRPEPRPIPIRVRPVRYPAQD
jgi:hypothetical protein